jgi:hypothetical protein
MVSSLSEGRRLAQRCAVFPKFRRFIATRIGEERLDAIDAEESTFEENIAFD